MKGALFIDPPSVEYYGNRLFDPLSPLNRDDCLAPFRQLRAAAEAQGLVVSTADALWQPGAAGTPPARSYYLSLGIQRNLAWVANHPAIVPLGLFLFEPPTTAPRRFLFLRRYERQVRRVFTLLAPDEHVGPFRVRGRQFRYPQAPLPAETGADRRESWLVAIFANKRPRFPCRELYSARRRTVAFFGGRGELDLFGPGWDRVGEERGGREAAWASGIARAWRGTTVDKIATLRRYRFAVCFENSRWRGYVTEKLFDCLRAGTIPIYWGAPDIKEIVDPEAFIDRQAFTSDAELAQFLHDLPEASVNAYREAGQAFLRSAAYRRFAPEAFGQLVLGLISEPPSEATTPV